MNLSRDYRQIRVCLVLTFAALLITAVACQPARKTKSIRDTAPSQEGVAGSTATLTTEASFTPAGTTPPSHTPVATETPLPSLTSTKTLIPTSTITPFSSLTLTPSITPTYAILRGTVLVQANCRYGPGAAYLYKYGLYPDNNIEIIGRNDPGTWIVIRAIGGTNPCWVKASLLDIKGDVMSLAPAELPLPISPYYGPLTGVYAERYGNEVIISWNALELRAGDDSLQYPYLVEAWLCQTGRLTFTPLGSWETSITVTDEPGCAEPSHARVYGVEKHGYTLWREVPWPEP